MIVADETGTSVLDTKTSARPSSWRTMSLLIKRRMVPLGLVADGLATIILRESSRRKIGEVFAGTLRDQDEIDDRARRELLALKMFCATRAASETLEKPGSAEKLLDLLHERIYASESATTEERACFEQHLRERYKVYHSILNGSSDPVRSLGTFFADKFLNTNDAAFIHLSAQTFFRQLELIRIALGQIYSEFDLE